MNSRLRLVGCMHIGAADPGMEWYGSTYGRLDRDVMHRGSLTRHAGYQGYAGELSQVHFLGNEVDRMDDIPDGMVGWDLDGDAWTLLDSRGEVIHQQQIQWQWSSVSPFGRTVGEFTAECPGEWTSHGAPALLEFRMTTNSYFSPDQQGCDDGIYLVDYDPSWPARYEEFAGWLRGELGADLALRIEHYGSTAIPGIPAKPIIDLLVEVPSFTAARGRAIPIFNRLDCDLWWYNDHLCFARRREFMGVRTHHIHMAPADHVIWEGIAFRDYLREHPEDAQRYADLKRGLAGAFRGERELYTVSKGDFVREITAKALQES